MNESMSIAEFILKTKVDWYIKLKNLTDDEIQQLLAAATGATLKNGEDCFGSLDACLDFWWAKLDNVDFDGLEVEDFSSALEIANKDEANDYSLPHH